MSTTSSISLSLIDHARARVSCDPSTFMDLYDYLSFEVPGSQFDPRVKRGQWDGFIHLLDKRSRTCPVGLASRVRSFCEENGHGYEDDFPGRAGTDFPAIQRFVEGLRVPLEYAPRDYQVGALKTAVETGRQLFVSPTSSGKSLIIYMVMSWFRVKTLIVVPTTGLTQQFYGDLISYGMGPESVSILGGGEKTDYSARVVVSTWQSASKMPAEWLDQFGMIVGDEAHLFAAESLTGIMNKAANTPLRFGFTGTLKGSKMHQLQLEALFGPTTIVTTTRKLMDQGYVADLDMRVVRLVHSEKSRSEFRERVARARADPRYRKMKRGALEYQQEIKFLYESERRNRFIVKMTSRLEGNVLVLFHHVDHGDALFDMMHQATDRSVHLVNGGVDGLERNEIRSIIEESDDAILLASVGTTSTGVSIRRINNMVLASPWKSRIVTLQSVGRSLRTASDKTSVTVYDLGDDLTTGGKPNYTLKHMAERVKIYASEDFSYKIASVDL